MYDCGIAVGREITEATWHQILSKTVIGVMVMAECIPGGGTLASATPHIKRIEAASRTLAKLIANETSSPGTYDFDALHTWQLTHEPAVPTLCLTSPSDVVIPEGNVRSFAEALRKAQPTRDVQVVALAGSHCQLGLVSRESYSRAIETLLERAVQWGCSAAASHGIRRRCHEGAAILVSASNRATRAASAPIPARAPRRHCFYML